MAGICFDSGGYNIKTGVNCGVELMKFDMGGAGAALGAASAVGALKPKGIEVTIICILWRFRPLGLYGLVSTCHLHNRSNILPCVDESNGGVCRFTLLVQCART